MTCSSGATNGTQSLTERYDNWIRSSPVMLQMLWVQATNTRAHSIATPSTCCGVTQRTTVAAIVRTKVTRKNIRDRPERGGSQAARRNGRQAQRSAMAKSRSSVPFTTAVRTFSIK
jgi:hypothetical protein